MPDHIKKQLLKEIQILEHELAHELPAEIKKAASLGDLSENAEYHMAKQRQVFVNARLGQLWAQWFAEMTDAEKSAFLDATLPTGFKQMLTSFEQLAPEKRKEAIDSAIKNLKDAREKSPEEYKKSNASHTNGPVLSEDLQKQVAVIGPKYVYSDSSAEAKAELAPLLEEIQRNMESGRMFRGGH